MAESTPDKGPLDDCGFSDEKVLSQWKKDLAKWEEPLREVLSSTFKTKTVPCLEKNRAILNPSLEIIFKAFALTPPDKVKVVIVGQDPTPTPGQATGIAFSAPKENEISIEEEQTWGVPPTTIKILKELYRSSLIAEYPKHACLERWAEQGVLLLNNCLTVNTSVPYEERKDWNDKRKKLQDESGWEVFTNEVIRVLCSQATKQKKKVVFMLWGNEAKEKVEVIEEWAKNNEMDDHSEDFDISNSVFTLDASDEENESYDTNGLTIPILILTSSHPNADDIYNTFYGCNHFSHASKFIEPPQIDWRLDPPAVEDDSLIAAMAGAGLETTNEKEEFKRFKEAS